MSDLLQEIEKRINKAEQERDNAIAQLEDLKKKLSANNIVIAKDKVYLMVYENRVVWLCASCPLCDMRVATCRCTVNRDCYMKGGRAYKIAEVVSGFLEKVNSERVECAESNRNRALLRTLKDIEQKAHESIEKANRELDKVKYERTSL